MRENRITKAEILWTRTCPLKCSYCAMADGRKNSRDLEFWKEVARQLKSLDCRFAAFYGAEPLADTENLEKLGDVLHYFSRLGIDTTLITSGAVGSFRAKVKELHDKGLRSLTMSCDILPLDDSSRAKSALAIDHLLWFKKLGARDVANVVTLTKWNYHLLPEHIEKMTEKGIWTFFDIIHDDRGQPGSKCRHTELTKELMFNEYHYATLGAVLRKVKEMKNAGYLCNTSIPFIELLEENNFSHIRNYDWSCANCKEFPGWVSIDCDGKVYPCDDFHIDNIDYYGDKIAEQFSAFREDYKKAVLDKCPGCLWNTHVDANMIKAGVLSGYGVEDAKNAR